MGQTIKLTDTQWEQLDHLRMSTASADVFRNCTIILMSAMGRSKASIPNDLGCCTDTDARVRRLYREGGAQALLPIKPPGRPSRATPEFINQMKRAVQTNPLTLGYGFSTWSAARLAPTSGQGDQNTFQRRSIAKAPTPRRVFHTSAQTYPQGQTGRTSIPKGQKRAYGLEKKAMRDDAEEALVFQDEMEIHCHPTLTRMWRPIGQQPEVPAPGKNEKRVVYGGVDYNSAKITYAVAQTKSGQNFLAFLIALVTAYAGRKVRLICDNGRFHQTKALLQWLKTHREHIQVFWLPPYCPSLNVIERL